MNNWPRCCKDAPVVVDASLAASVRDWPGVPRFSHGLIDQSALQPEAIQGALKAQIMQLLLMAASHPAVAWMDRVARLLGSLAPSGGIDYVRIFVLYIVATQEPQAALSFREVLQRYAPAVGDHLMTYAQELLKEGQVEGEIKAEVRIIENLLREGMAWAALERVTGVNAAQFQTLKQQVAAMNG